MIAAIYARKSNEQGVPDEAKSVTRQVEHATAYTQRKGWTVHPSHVYVDDAISGAEFVNRPGLARLLTALSSRPFQVVVMAEPSRLGREQIETAYTLKRITDADVRVFYYLNDHEALMDTALAKVMASLTGFAAEQEREQARVRTHDAMARKAKAGHVTGGLTYGYTNVRRDGHVARQINEREAAVVKRIFADYVQGIGPRALAVALAAEGAIPPKPRQRGAVPGWSRAAILDILKRDLYRGEIVWNRLKKTDRGGRTKVRVTRATTDLIRVQDESLRIIDDVTWEAAQARRQKMAGTRPAGSWTRSTTPSTPALLAGIARCAGCGAPLTRRGRPNGSGKNRTRIMMYVCSSRNRPGVCANAVALKESILDDAVLHALADALSADAIEAAVKRAMAEAKAELSGSADRRVELDRDIRTVETRLARLMEALAAGTMPVGVITPKVTEEEARRVSLTRERDALATAGAVVDYTNTKVLAAIKAAAGDVRAALLEHRTEAKDVLSAFLDTIVFTPFGAGRARGYEFKGTGDYGSLIGQAVKPLLRVVSPTGFEPVLPD